MQKVEEFMRELIHTRIAEEKRILANRASYRKLFFTPDCRWDSRQFTLEMIKTERVKSIEHSDLKAVVITEYKASVSPPGAKVNRRRYHLISECGSYLISRVEHQCPYCHGQGDAKCLGCKGNHWI
jgi:hypothetical protein